MHVNREAQQQLQPSLDANERLLWAGRPRQGLVLRNTDFLLIPFSLLWCGFAIFWELSVLSSGGPPFFLLFGGVFVVIGLYFVAGRFFADSLRRKKTYYGVTDKRVLIKSSKELSSLVLQGLPQTSLTEHSNNLGTITFGTPSSNEKWFAGTGWPGVTEATRFDQIQNAKSVFDLVRGQK